MDYLDFELEISQGAGCEYPVAVLRSPAGEARATLHFPFDQLALESRLKDLQIALLRSGGKRRSALSDEETAVQGFGQALFEAVFAGEVRSRYDVSCERAAQKEQGVRLKLRIQAPELAALPWEFLYDPRQGEYLCLSRNTPVVRYLELQQPVPSLKVSPPLRILGMIASPCDQAALDATGEKQRVERAVADLRARGLVDLTWLEGQTWRDIQRAMRGRPWHIFHYVGHGAYDKNADEGLIVLAGDDGRSAYLSATQLARLLANHRSLRLVVLNACEGAKGGKLDIFSSTASILVRRGIPAVIAMQYEITDRAAIEFGRAFYEAVADGLPVDAAATEARTAVSMQVTNTVEWGTPVLYMRTPDGVLFDMVTSSPQTRPVSLPAEQPVQATTTSEWAAVVAPIGSTPVQDEPAARVAAASAPSAPAVGEPADISGRPVLDNVAREPAPAAFPAPSRRDSHRPSWRWVAAVGLIGLLAVIVFTLVKTSTDRTNRLAVALTSTALVANTLQPTLTSAAPALPPPTKPPTSANTLQPTLTSAAPALPPPTRPPASANTSTPSRPTTQTTPAPGATMTWPVADMVMVWVPAGEFTMGSGDADSLALDDEKPQHKVYVDGFWMSRTEITNGQYSRCVQAGQCTAPNNQQYTSPELANRPVASVTWQQATDYARWVGGRLPTEAEWEKACRGADARIYPWGDNPPSEELARSGYGTAPGTADVGSYPKGASPYGLLDMAGNVWEWTSSVHENYPYRADDGREGQNEGYHVLRGGSLFYYEMVRCATRMRESPYFDDGDVGFRVCASPSHS